MRDNSHRPNTTILGKICDFSMVCANAYCLILQLDTPIGNNPCCAYCVLIACTNLIHHFVIGLSNTMCVSLAVELSIAQPSNLSVLVSILGSIGYECTISVAYFYFVLTSELLWRLTVDP